MEDPRTHDRAGADRAGDAPTDPASAFRALRQEIERVFPAASAHGQILQPALLELGELLDDPGAALPGLDGLEDTLTALLLTGQPTGQKPRKADDA